MPYSHSLNEVFITKITSKQNGPRSSSFIYMKMYYLVIIFTCKSKAYCTKNS